MAPVIPDCGIFSTPRREPSLKTLVQIKDKETVSPVPAKTTPTSHRLANLSLGSSPGTSGITLESGFSFGFYKAPKTLFTPAAPVVSPVTTSKSMRRPKDGINRGVGHKIKKPKLKAKEKLKPKKDVKTITKRLKEGTYTPYLPSSRSPLKKSPVSNGLKKQRRALSSPGMSLLEGQEEDKQEFIKTKDSKFFTSKSRAAATVHIGKNIKLSAKYGDVTLKQREGGFVKKNIGRKVEDELHQYLDKKPNSTGDEMVQSLPSVQVNPRPVPTRVPGTPSPIKKALVQRRPRNSPVKKGKKIDMGTENEENKDKSIEGDLLDLEMLLEDWDDDGSPVKSPRKKPQQRDTESLSTPVRRSPRKTGEFGTPSKRLTQRVNGSPARRSPRKLTEDVTPSKRQANMNGSDSPSKRQAKMNGSDTPSKVARMNGSDSPSKIAMVNGSVSPSRSPNKTRRSPRKSNGFETPSKRRAENIASSPANSPIRKTPRKLNGSVTPSRKTANNSPVRASPRRQAVNKLNGDTGIKNKSAGTPKDASKSVKMFPIFDPKTRLSDQAVSSLSGKKSVRGQNKGEDSTQMIIDAGQKRFGLEQCPECGIVYEVGSLSDAASHKTHHNRFLSVLKFTGWKKEHPVRNVDMEGGRTIMVTGDDPDHFWRKVNEVREVIDNELGFEDNRILTKENTKVFMKVLNNRIVGMLIAERISQAYRIIPQISKPQDQGRLACCSETPSKVWAGVSRIWVLKSQRKKGIATLLVDCMRENMIPNSILNMDQIAFSDPTEGGMIFAEKYTKKPDFLVYRRNL